MSPDWGLSATFPRSAEGEGGDPWKATYWVTTGPKRSPYTRPFTTTVRGGRARCAEPDSEGECSPP